MDQFRHRYGPWALVTGASDGIGRAFAERAAARGLDVLLVARRRNRLDEVAARIAATGRAAEVLEADLAHREGVARTLSLARSRDIGLVVCAAGFGSSGPALDGALENELAMVDVNCRAVLETVLGLAPRLVDRGRGAVVLLSSIVAFQGVRGAANYAATKAYVQSLGEGLHAELAAKGVDVSIVAPGPVHSGFATRAGMRMTLAATPEQVAEGALRALARAGTVRPGALSRMLGYSLASLPRATRIRMLSHIMGRMTAHRAR